jgi:hypothetical protein
MIKAKVTVAHGGNWYIKLSDGRAWFQSKKNKHERNVMYRSYPGLKHALKKLHDTITFEDTENVWGESRKTRRKKNVKRGSLG